MTAIDFFGNIPDELIRIYRLTKVRNRSDVVWNELIKLHKNLTWHFGQYENDKYLETIFEDEDNNLFTFHYSVDNQRLILSGLVLPGFDDECINDIMILSSHFNNLLTNGNIRVNIEHSYGEYILTGDLLRYLLYPAEIYVDILRHHSITEECFRTFTEMINTKDEPVFVFAEFVKRIEQKNKGKTIK